MSKFMPKQKNDENSHKKQHNKLSLLDLPEITAISKF